MYLSLKTLLILITLKTCSSSSQNSTRSKKFEKPVLETQEDHEIANYLQKYFHLRDDCQFDSYNHSVKHCPPTADYVLCFPPTEPNHTIYFNCPYTQGLVLREKDVKISRYCNSSGQWASTEYSPCIMNVIRPRGSNCHLMNHTIGNVTTTELECDSMYFNYDKLIYQIMTWCNLIGFCITVLFVSVAIFIFLSIRALRCIRNMIHCNMLFTFLFKSIAHFGFYVFILSSDENFSESNHFLCVVFNIILNYSLMSSFFWMMIEAVYLITVIVAAYSSNKIKLWWYLVIGWIVPMVPIVPYAIITYHSSETTCSWTSFGYNPVHEILIDAPIYFLLMINCILLFVILYVIISKLRTHNDAVKTKYARYKKLTRAILVLFPLFGLSFAVCFWLPSDPTTLFSKIYYFVNIFLQTTQGVWVALVYCLLNDEVKNAVHTKLRSWKVTHVGSSLLSFGSSTSRHHSVPTLYSTQLSTNNSVTRQRQDSNLNDPSKLPMLQEDKL